MTEIVDESFEGSGTLTHSTNWSLEGSASLKINGDWPKWPRARVPDMRHLVMHELPETYGELTDDDVKAWYGGTATVTHRENGWTVIDTPHVDILMESHQVIGAPAENPYIERVKSDSASTPTV